MRTRAKVDVNQKEIVTGLRKLGYSVRHTHAIGKGFSDIVVGAHKKNFLFEIKDGEKVPSKQKLTPDEQEFHDSWRGQINIITTIDEALQIINS